MWTENSEAKRFYFPDSQGTDKQPNREADCVSIVQMIDRVI